MNQITLGLNLNHHRSEHTGYYDTLDMLAFSAHQQLKDVYFEEDIEKRKITVKVFDDILCTIRYSHNEPKFYLEVFNKTYRLTNSHEALFCMIHHIYSALLALDRNYFIFEL